VDRPIKAELFLVRNEDHAAALKELEDAGAPYCTFPHHSGDYVAVAVGSISKEEIEERKRSQQAQQQPPPLPPKISLFPGGGN
jgi:hypothetical protein